MKTDWFETQMGLNWPSKLRQEIFRENRPDRDTNGYGLALEGLEAEPKNFPCNYPNDFELVKSEIYILLCQAYY